jgi:hypothetical protein
LREDRETLNGLAEQGLSPIKREQGQKLANKVRAVKYMECSALTQRGLKQVWTLLLFFNLLCKNSYNNRLFTHIIICRYFLSKLLFVEKNNSGTLLWYYNNKWLKNNIIFGILKIKKKNFSPKSCLYPNFFPINLDFFKLCYFAQSQEQKCVGMMDTWLCSIDGGSHGFKAQVIIIFLFF